MKYLILTILLIIINNQAMALELSLVQGFAHHYVESGAYNDSVFKDSLTSTNTLLNITHNKYTLTLLADSQGDLSTALTYSHNIMHKPKYNIKTVLGIYNIRSDKLYMPIVDMFPRFNIGSRSYNITPLVGLELEYKINKTFSIDVLITPAFTLAGIKLSL